jgi:hypothetical protein
MWKLYLCITIIVIIVALLVIYVLQHRVNTRRNIYHKSCRDIHKSRSKKAKTITLIDTVATKRDITSRIQLPQLPEDGQDHVYNVILKINVVEACLGKPIISKPDIESITSYSFDEEFIFDTTWSPRLLPLIDVKQGPEICGSYTTFTFDVPEGDEDNHIDIAVDIADNKYLSITYNIMLVSVYPDKQDLSDLKFISSV